MATGRVHTRGSDGRPNEATLAPRDYGRVTCPDGKQKWWVRASDGSWTRLTHHQVTENEDCTITVSSLR